jgi:outer membrane protein assembly factor BamB
LLLHVATLPVFAAAPQTAASFQNGGTTSLGKDSLPRDWSPDSNVAWSVATPGYGQSSPIAFGDRAYVTSVSGPQKESFHLTAIRLEDGSTLWQREVKNASPQESSNYVSRAAPTPAADALGAIAFFEGGNLVAYDLEGNVRWERNLVAEYGPIAGRHGIAASVEQDDAVAYIWVERATDPYAIAVDKKSGKNLWKAPGLGVTSWASPRLVPVAGGRSFGAHYPCPEFHIIKVLQFIT